MTIDKVVRLGTIDAGYSIPRQMDIFCHIQYSNGKLSISGVEGPKRTGNCMGSCGQIVHHLKDQVNDITPAPGWSRDLIAKFLELWGKWHLNDLRAGCEHQRAAGWGDSEIEVYTYRLNSTISASIREIKRDLHKRVESGESVHATSKEVALLALPFEITGPRDCANQDVYKLHNVDRKSSGLVYEKIHPTGVLCKPCPTCGYEYGSAWLIEEVPARVIDFLSSLPVSDKIPAWV